MQPAEKQELIDSLNAGRRALIDAVDGVTEELAKRAEAGRWSILQCVEHLALAENDLFGRILAAAPTGAPVVNERRERIIRERGASRTRPITAPDVAAPHGHYATLAEALEAFSAGRARTVAFVESCTTDLRAQLTTHPVVTGPVNCHEMLLMMAVHPFRHVSQIQEIRAAK
jgi:hypothetical protein